VHPVYANIDPLRHGHELAASVLPPLAWVSESILVHDKLKAQKDDPAPAR
jgi:hypothetical protein